MSHASQRDRLRILFEANLGKPIPLHEILSLRISQYGTRILELRREGYDIRNETVDVVGGQKHTAFTYYGRRVADDYSSPQPQTITEENSNPADDWYVAQTGQARPKESAPDSPLFDGARR